MENFILSVAEFSKYKTKLVKEKDSKPKEIKYEIEIYGEISCHHLKNKKIWKFPP